MAGKSRTSVAYQDGQEQKQEARPFTVSTNPEEYEKLVWKQVFAPLGVDPFDTVEWELREALIMGEDGKPVFQQQGVEFPVKWSQMATNVVASKYFRGTLGTPQRESSVRQLIGRVVKTITGWAKKQGYFHDDQSVEAFGNDLIYLLLHQYASFNSPVWFNCGAEPHPQCSACFINSVQDSMEGILDLAKIEGLLFKWGSGTGTNFSSLRSSKELVQGGGTASGPVSFMRGYDAFAGVIKSGGKTRRAAKMVILNADHPDILDFIQSKVHEERKAWALIDAGYDGSFGGEAYGSVFFQNSNNSVRVTDEFMEAVTNDKEWATRKVTSGEPLETLRAKDLMRTISEAAHQCGDPGLQYDTTINSWHTCPNSGRINASNPCSEFMFLDDSACNLASLNLMKFLNTDGSFDVAKFRKAVSVFIISQEVIVDNASYPTSKIATNSYGFRPLGLGYANLGAVLMAQGLPYDSDEGREYAGALTALMTGAAYSESARIARAMGPFEHYSDNAEPMLQVMRRHRECTEQLRGDRLPAQLRQEAVKAWDEVIEWGEKFGFRNSQVSVLAPTGTIAFMMDCDTTGIEPDIALIKYKKLVGGGMLKIVNNTVPRALERLGYNTAERDAIISYINENDTIEGAPHLNPDHLPVFDCAFQPEKGKRFIQYMGHVRMMSAVQPFISGAISKTVNMPNDATVEDIMQTYLEGWRLGLKAIAIYRDGCKRTQPLTTSKGEKSAESASKEPAKTSEPAAQVVYKPVRRRLPDERNAITHKFDIAGHEGYITVGMYEDNTPGEIFLVMAKEGSVISGLMDAFATAISLALQYGVPLQVLIDKFSHARFEPSGMTKNPEIPIAKSVIDYIFRWLASKFLPEDQRQAIGLRVVNTKLNLASPSTAPASQPVSSTAPVTFNHHTDALSCSECGSIMVRNGACYKCLNCGSTSGCS